MGVRRNTKALTLIEGVDINFRRVWLWRIAMTFENVDGHLSGFSSIGCNMASLRSSYHQNFSFDFQREIII